MRNLPGRKTDIKDAEWIAQLLQHGLLSNSFTPEKTVRTMRELSRQRRHFVREHSTYSNRIEKFLQRHGFKLSSVVNSIMGVSSQRILYMLADKGELSI
jgi:transposase